MSWQALERKWRAAPTDQDLLARALEARRKAKAPPSPEMLEARVFPSRTFESAEHYYVSVMKPDGELVGPTSMLVTTTSKVYA